MPTSAAALDAPFTIHLSAAGDIHTGLIRTLAAPPGSRVARLLAVDARRGLETLARLVWLSGWGILDRDSVEVTGWIDPTAADLEAARALGGAIRPVAFAEQAGSEAGGRAFVGPAFLPLTEPLASIDAALTGIRLDFRRLEAAASRAHARTISAPPRTPWLLRITFPGLVPSDPTVRQLVSNAGLGALRIEGAAFSTTTRWVLTGERARGEIDAAVARLTHAHRLKVASIRSL